MKATIELEANSLINEHIIVTISGERKQLAQADVQCVFIQDTDELRFDLPPDNCLWVSTVKGFITKRLVFNYETNI